MKRHREEVVVVPTPFPWQDLFLELQHTIRREHLDECGRACLAMTCMAESQERQAGAPATYRRENLSVTAARLGYRELFVMFYMRCRDYPYSLHSDHVCAAAEGGQLEMLLFLKKRRIDIERFRPAALVKAAFRGHLLVVQWLITFSQRMELPVETKCLTFSAAARSGSLPLLTWLHGRGCPMDPFAYHRAISQGHWNVVEWLHTVDCPRDVWAFREAARSGADLSRLKWLRERDFPWDGTGIGDALVNGGEAVMEWLREMSDVPWSYDTLSILIERQPSLDLLLCQVNWILGQEQGFSGTRERVFKAAVMRKIRDVIVLLWRRGFGRWVFGSYRANIRDILTSIPSPDGDGETLLDWMRANP